MDIFSIYTLSCAILILTYLLGRLVDSIMKFLHLNNLTSRTISFLVRALGILMPTFIGILTLACVSTLNVPINFLIIIVTGLLFGKYVMDYIAGLIFRITSKASMKDTIIVLGESGDILTLDTFSLSLQTPNGMLILPYSLLFQKGYTVSKKLHVANRFELTIEFGQGEIDFEATKSDLISILSGGGYIGKFSLPTLTINHHTNQLFMQIYLDSMEDPMDLVLLLKEKNYVCH